MVSKSLCPGSRDYGCAPSAQAVTRSARGGPNKLDYEAFDEAQAAALSLECGSWDGCFRELVYPVPRNLNCQGPATAVTQ